MATIECRGVSFQNIEAVIFDKDGTLEDTADFLRNLGQKRARMIDAQIPGVGEPLLMAYGIEGDELDPAGLMAVGSRRENEIASAAYVAETGRGWLESLEIVSRAFEEANRPLKNNAPCPLFTGTTELLKILSDGGLKLGILSADTTENVLKFVSYYQLESYIQLQMGVDGGVSKPDPSLFLAACRTLAVSPQSALMVGDSPVDIQMARNAQAAGCIAICRKKSAHSHLKDADVIISQLNEISIVS
ncbi:HAD family hydrolase [Ancylothrix sp. C2]|uniref:HAD family hydrolase n=1 Tax=Ancylothrix sp. D3o TaxID=2953691 RepID=UPI0021BBA81E|nr:HAD family hydrolase [Ancylothrix sp. D3o]MCT7950584.1 HAD family hydrolase [Ancylothrix sp. D3o]